MVVSSARERAVSYQPQFTITPRLLSWVEQITALRERILATTVQVQWIPALQKDTRQGAINLLRPLVAAGLVRRIGTKKTGRYMLRT